MGYTNYDKLHKDIRRDSSNRVSWDLREKERAKNYVRRDKYDLGIRKKGVDWFNSGLPWEDAPEELRNNTNFTEGFDEGKRLAFIAELQKKDKSHGR